MLNALYYDRKRINLTSADVLHLLLCLFFTSNTAVLLVEAQKYFSLGRRVPLLRYWGCNDYEANA